MTDTPRTQAELLEIFKDDQVGGISAQDMRDFVKSLSNPVDGFGLNGRLSDRFANALLTPASFDLPASPAGNYGDARAIPLTAVADPEGWFDNSFTLDADDPAAAWGVDISAGQAAMLPPGAYQVNSFSYYGTTPVTPVAPYKAFVYTEFDQQTWDPDYSYALPRDVSGGWVWRGYYGPMIQSEITAPHPLSGVFVTTNESVVVVNDTEVDKPYALVGGLIDHTAVVTLRAVYLTILKVA